MAEPSFEPKVLVALPDAIVTPVTPSAKTMSIRELPKPGPAAAAWAGSWS